MSDPDVPTRYAKYIKDIRYALYANTHPCESTNVVHKICKPGRNRAVSRDLLGLGRSTYQEYTLHIDLAVVQQVFRC